LKSSIEGTPYGKRIADDMHVCTNRAPLDRERSSSMHKVPDTGGGSAV